MKTRIALWFVLALALLQLRQPARNQDPVVNRNDITFLYAVPDDVQLILQQACYDCHSNNTHYPWYSRVQPIGWWLQFHVDEGKQALNFSEFGTYYQEDHPIILKELHEVITRRSMPLDSYVLMHEEADLTPVQVELLDRWIQGLRTSVAKDR